MNDDIIAIDGPAASGKSTVARGVARELGYLYLDSGALYRGVTWQALERNIRVTDGSALVGLVADLKVEFAVADGAIRFSMDGTPLGIEIRAPRVDAKVSPVAATPGVRQAVVRWLRQAVTLGPLVTEGRDIGTAVFPDARHKFYLDASPKERARRRYGELAERTETVTRDDVDRALRQRDAMDSERQVDPLRVAPNAIVIDTTALLIDDVVRKIVAIVRESSDA